MYSVCISAIIFMLMFLYITPIYADTHYVSPNGTASWASSVNINTPCSASVAMKSAQAGDVVYFRGGTYNVTNKRAYHAALEPSNSGTATNPITFAAYPNELPKINITSFANGWESDYCIGTGNRNYIIWDGFECTAMNGEYMGGCMIGGDLGGSQFCTIRNSTFHGGSHIISHTDNAELIRMENTSYTTIQNCKIYNARQASNWPNTCGIKMYYNDHATIENCEIYNCTAATHIKCENDYITIRNNYVHNNYHGIYGTAYNTRTNDYGKAYNNLIVNNSCTSFFLSVDSDTGTNNNWQFYNNTIYHPNGSGDCFIYGNGKNWNIYNNILITRSGTLNLKTIRLSSITSCDHNQFGTTSFGVQTRAYNSASSYSSLNAWKLSGELASGGNPGQGSMASNPLFKNISGNMDQIRDFDIAQNSPCKAAGRNGEDIGANINVVGVGFDISGDTTPPSSPVGIAADVIK